MRNSPHSYQFIDGSSLMESLEEMCRTYRVSEEFRLSWGDITRGEWKTFYYDAIPVKLESETDTAYFERTAAKRAQLADFEQQDRVHVRTGDVRRRRRRGNEQKMVDVNLAVDALLMASRSLFDRCAVVTGDLDFLPLISALVEMGVHVDLFYPLQHTNPELISASDAAIPISAENAHMWIAQPHEIFSLGLALQPQSGAGPIGGDIILEWEDQGFGACMMTLEGDRYKVGPLESTHGGMRQIAVGRSLEHTKMLSRERLGLAVPDVEAE